MNIIRHVLSAVVCTAVFLPSVLIAQWEQTSGPSGGLFLSFTILHPSPEEQPILFAGSGSRLYTSTNFGKSWLLADSGEKKNALVYLETVEGTLFAMRGSTTMRSTNMGENWHDISSGLQGQYVVALAATNDNENILLAATHGYFVFRSTDMGNHWTPVNTGLTSSLSTSLVISPTAARDAYVATTDGIFHSTNLGDTWVRLDNLQTQTSYAVLSVVPDSSAAGETRIYVGDAAGGLHHSTDKGLTWSRQTVGSSTNNVRAVTVVSRTNQDSLLLTSSEGIFRSDDGGSNWKPASTGLQDLNVTRILVCDDWAFALTRSDIYSSSDQGMHWVEASAGTFTYLGATNALISLPAEGPFDEVLLAGGRGTGISSTTDYGLTWSKHNEGHSGEYVYALHSSTISFPPYSRFVWAGCENGVLRSSDRGLTWQKTSTGMGNRRVQTIHLKPRNDGLGDYLFAGLYGEPPFLSGNYGDNWRDMGYSMRGISYFVSQGNTLYATGPKFLQSTDDGETWSEIHSGLYPVVIFPVEGRTYLCGGSGKGVDISTDGGLSWKHSQITQGPNEFVLCLISVERNGKRLLFAGTQAAGVFLSDDLGETWNDISAGLHDRTVNSLAVVGPYLFAGTRDWGVWRRPLSELTGMNTEAAAMPSGISLAQNYPNPFHSETIVSFHIPMHAFVSLRFYNALGREVGSLVSAPLNPGKHAFRWDARELPEGLYFCRLTANNTVLTKKMILMK